jgi:hypothetical protein
MAPFRNKSKVTELHATDLREERSHALGDALPKDGLHISQFENCFPDIALATAETLSRLQVTASRKIGSFRDRNVVVLGLGSKGHFRTSFWNV